MRLGLFRKLMLLLLLCGVVPMIAVSALLISIGRHQTESDVEQIHRLQADAAAASVSQFLQRSRNRLTMDLEGSIQAMSDDDVQRTLVWMLNKQDNLIHFRILRVFDERGAAIGDPVRLPQASIPADQRPFYLVQDQDLPDFARHVPLAEALKTGEAEISPVYVNARRREALVAIAVPIVDRLHQVQAIVAGEVSLREVQRIVSDVSLGSVGFAYLVDGTGRAIAHPQFDLVKDGSVLTGNGIVEWALGSRSADSVAFVGEGGVPQLGAHAPVVWSGWQLIVQQPAADAFRPVHDMKVRAAYILIVALIVSAACGALYVRSLVGPLRSVMDGMRHIVEGQFDHRLDASTDDEVGELARAFNAMGRMLAGYRGEVLGWNQQLQARVDSKTRALESAQSQLIQTAKLSSLGQLGAGVAHELNNPLAGLVGQAALLKRRLKKLDLAPEDRERLEGYVHHIETESARCREIVHGLLSFSQTSAIGTDSVDVNDSITKLLLLLQANLRSAGLTVTTELDREVPAIEANAHQLQQVLMHLVTNAQQAMPTGGTLVISTRREGDGVAIALADTGRGIPEEHRDKIFDPFFTTKDVWQSPGLGLSVCYSIVESHGGHIAVESKVGAGSTFTILLPARASRSSAPREEPVGLRRGRAVPVGAAS